ncbi:MAG: hypothetical protein GWN00_05135 [Aliifodinibius sp.]|nr:hypothetical protein [Fodinibius sp.]NIV10585.1 hypothetical protein [Fodinibius sp.]NIY24213.1 hypothetical protein [Fodinibius sp.]
MENKLLAEGSNLLVLVPVVASILLAVAGYIFTYFHKRRVDARAARLDRVNLQLRKLYGPLYAREKAGKAVWAAFKENFWPAHGQPDYFGGETSEKEEATWRLWMKEVFHPLNVQIEKTILENIDLLEGGEFPAEFINAIAHVNSYKAIIKQWEEGDYSQHWAVCPYPRDMLPKIVEHVYRELLKEQRTLILGTK